jgi:hypothetical protein
MSLGVDLITGQRRKRTIASASRDTRCEIALLASRARPPTVLRAKPPAVQWSAPGRGRRTAGGLA